MTGELTIFRQGGMVPSTAFQGVSLPIQRLDDGVSAGFAKLSYKGGRWGIKYQGQYNPVQARMPDGTIIQSPFLDVVILRSAGHPSKAWYEGLYAEGDNAPPDCWSTNGFKPDIGVPKQQSPTCIGCQWNVWGSKVNRDTGEATRGKACMDSKRIAVVPVGDIENKYYGGPMMLNVPPTSLKRLGPYQNGLEANGFHYAQVWTRITFEPQSAYPLFVFDAMSALNDVQAQQVIKMMNHPLIDRILNTELRTAEAWDDPTLQQFEVKSQVQVGQPVTSGASMPAGGAQGTPSNDPGPIPAHLVRTPPASGPAPGTPQAQQAPPVGTGTSVGTIQSTVSTGVPAGTPQPATPEPEPEPEITLPGGMVLPPGMTPEMAQAFLQQFAGQGAQPQKRGRGRPRTPPVQPTNMDSAQVAGAPGPNPDAAQQTLPLQPTMVMPTPAGSQQNGAAAPDRAVSSIMSTVKSLL